MFAESPVQITWQSRAVFTKFCRPVPPLRWCACFSLWASGWSEMDNHAISVRSVGVAFSFSPPVPNFSCNSFCRPGVINSGIQGCCSYIERVLDSRDLAFTLVLMLPCQPEKYDPPKSSWAISPVFRTGFLKLSGKNIYFARENSSQTIFLFLVTRFISAAVRREHLDFLRKQFLNPLYLDIWKLKGISLLYAEGWLSPPSW